MAGIVHIPWYATVFRGDKLEAALAEIAPVALRYGATSYAVHRNRDDALQVPADGGLRDQERLGAVLVRAGVLALPRPVPEPGTRCPLLYTWADVVVEGALDDEAAGTTAAIGQHAQ